MSQSKKGALVRAIGLSYDARGPEVPSISVKGHYFRAAEIVKIARKYGVRVVERPALARALDVLDPDQEIPEDLFQAVAVLLAELKPTNSWLNPLKK